MAVSPIMRRAARGLELVAVIAQHTALLDALSGHSAAGAPARTPVSGRPPSAALAHPTRRPAFLAQTTAARGASARAGQSPRRAAQGEAAVAALAPAWQAMAPGERRPDAIPERAENDRSVLAQSIYGRRQLAAQDDAASADARPAASADVAPGAAIELARKALRERARFLAPLLAASRLFCEMLPTEESLCS